MANKTVYPYGTGGQLPSSIGLINDLGTGGVDKALTAEQGKVIGQMIGGVTKTIVCTDKQANKGVAASNGLSSFGTIEGVNSRSVFGPVDCSGFDYVIYDRIIQTTAVAQKYGIVFYDENDTPICGYGSLYGDSSSVSFTAEIPQDASYFYSTHWTSAGDSQTYVLVSNSKIEKPDPLVNVLGAQIELDTPTIATEKSLNFFRLKDGGVYSSAISGGSSMDPRLIIDLSERDFSKQYKLTLKYNYSGTGSVWCVYVREIRQSGSNGSVFSSSAIPQGQGTLEAYLEPNGNDKLYIRISAQQAGAAQDLILYGLQIEEVPLSVPPVLYYGQKISFGYPISCKALKVRGGGQGSANYGDYYFTTDNNYNIVVSNIRTGETLATVLIESEQRGFVSNPHWNTINFGSLKYDNEDYFPLMYCSTGYDDGTNSGCIVYRIQMSENEGVYSFTITHVQTLKFPGKDWTEFITGGDYLYVFNTVIPAVYKFNFPTLSDGSVVVLDLNNAVETYVFPPKGFNASGQGCLYHQDKIYTVHGMPSQSTRALTVMDLKTRTWATFLNLDDLGFSNSEPEAVFIWEGQLCIAFKGLCQMLFY